MPISTLGRAASRATRIVLLLSLTVLPLPAAAKDGQRPAPKSEVAERAEAAEKTAAGAKAREAAKAAQKEAAEKEAAEKEAAEAAEAARKRKEAESAARAKAAEKARAREAEEAAERAKAAAAAEKARAAKEAEAAEKDESPSRTPTPLRPSRKPTEEATPTGDARRLAPETVDDRLPATPRTPPTLPAPKRPVQEAIPSGPRVRPLPDRAAQVIGGLIVRVEDRDGGAPVTNANVCLGRPGSPVAYGITRTDGRGDAHFPTAPRDQDLQVIAARDGYEGTLDTVDYDSPSDSDVEGCPPFGLADGEVFDPDAVGDCEAFDRDTIEIERGAGGPTCPPQEVGTLRLVVANGAGAVACLGGPAGSSSHGAAVLDATGVAELTNVPLHAPLRLIVDRAGFDRLNEALVLGSEGVTERSLGLSPGDTGGQLSFQGGECVQQVHEVAPQPLPSIADAEEEEPAPGPIQRRAQGPLDLDEVMEAAEARGYVFSVEAMNEPAICSLRSDGTIALFQRRGFGGVLFTEAARCRVRLFQGPALNVEWALTEVDVEPHPHVGLEWVQFPNDRLGGEPLAVFDLTLIGSGETTTSVAVMFYGPEGEDWRDAFE